MNHIYKSIKFLSVILVGSFLIYGCSKDDDDSGTTLPDKTLPVKTVMVYLDGDNNLESFALTDLNEMEGVNLSDSNIKVVVLIDRIDGEAVTSPDWTGTRLYEISYDSAGSSNSDIVSTRLSSTELGISATSDSDELNMGDPDTLTKFINFCKANYEGNYALILWNHGGGWMKKSSKNINSLNNSVTKAVCWDETSSDDSLYMDEVQTAIANKGLTVIGFDACLMGMIEVAYELRNSASYMIASEETIPGDGWAYDQWLETFSQSSGKTGEQLCNAVVDAYEAAYASTSSTTLSALDLSKVDNVFSALNSFSQALYNDITNSTIQNSIWNLMFNSSENYWQGSGSGSDFNIDLYDFADRVESGYNYCDTESAALKSAIDDCVIYEWHNTSGHPNSHGLAIHAAATDYSDDSLQMYKAYCNGNTEDYPVDFVQNSSNYWVPRISGNSVAGPGLLYRILYESL